MLNDNKSKEKKEYLCQVTIVEARSLSAKDASGTSDPFVKITVANLPTQVTTTKPGANTVVYD